MSQKQFSTGFNAKKV